MNRYKVYFNEQGRNRYGKETDVIWGDSETDALNAYGYKWGYVRDIFQAIY